MSKYLCIALLTLTNLANATSELPNFSTYSNQQKRKQAFFTYVSQLAQTANTKILENRTKATQLRKRYTQSKTLSPDNQIWLQTMAQRYRLKNWDITKSNKWNTLLRRVDIIPMSILLAQAAKESAWGTSRFAREGNNLFGQWCFKQGCGLIPEQRPKNGKYEVRAFPNALASVKSYMRNLNTNRHYKNFRLRRATLRAENKRLSGYVLAEGLNKYSQRGTIYVKEVRQLITANQLSKFGVA